MKEISLPDIELAWIYVAHATAVRKEFVDKFGLDPDKDYELVELKRVLDVLNKISRAKKEKNENRS